jgi:hypothetical protein
MKPRVTLRQALDDPSLLGAALAGPSWHAWRSLLLAAMGEPLQPDELETFTRFTGRSTPPAQRVDELVLRRQTRRQESCHVNLSRLLGWPL